MRTSLLSCFFRVIGRLFKALISALLLCLILLLIADVLQCVGGLFTNIGRDKVLSLGKWKFVFREEILTVCREKWDMLCRGAESVIPTPLPEMAVGVGKLITRAFFQR